MSRVMIGVDVCQAWLDAYVRSAEVSRRFANTPHGMAELIVWAPTTTTAAAAAAPDTSAAGAARSATPSYPRRREPGAF